MRPDELTRIAAGLAHETKNPLMIVRGLGQSVLRDLHDPEALRGHAFALIDQVDRVVRQIDGFLDLTRPRLPDFASVNLGELCRELVELLGDEAEVQGIAMSTEVPDVRVRSDAKLLRQILVNLIINAVGACRPGHSIRLTWSAPEGELAVLDDGPGMTEEQWADAMQPYVSFREGGTGLGLSIATRLAADLGCQLRLSPREQGIKAALRGLGERS